jgi:hypothetical protein
MERLRERDKRTRKMRMTMRMRMQSQTTMMLDDRILSLKMKYGASFHHVALDH